MPHGGRRTSAPFWRAEAGPSGSVGLRVMVYGLSLAAGQAVDQSFCACMRQPWPYIHTHTRTHTHSGFSSLSGLIDLSFMPPFFFFFLNSISVRLEVQNPM